MAAERPAATTPDLNEAVRILKRRALATSEKMTQEVEEAFPTLYESLYWLTCGVRDYLGAFESEDVQVEWALDVLARVPYESGQEIGELIEERRNRVAS